MSALLPFAQYRREVFELLKTVRGIETVREHQGQFSDEDVKQIAMVAPALHVAVLAIRPVEPDPSGNITCTLKMAVFIVTGEEAGQSRDTAALNIAAGLMLLLERRQVKSAGLFMSRPPTNFAWQNGFAAGTQGAGTMVSAVTFDTVLTLSRDLTEPELLDFRRFYLGGELVLEGSA